MTASSSALWSGFGPPSNFVNGHMSTVWFVVCRWPQSQEGDWARPHLCKLARHGALTCPEKVHQRPRVTKEIKTWLSDSRVGDNSVADHRSRRPVLFPLRNCVDHSGRRSDKVPDNPATYDQHQHTQANLLSYNSMQLLTRHVSVD